MGNESRLRFTKAALTAIGAPADRSRAVYHDTEVKGLVLIVTANGAKSFYVYRRVEGQPTRVFIGRFPDLSVEQARKMAEENNGAIAAGRNPHKERKDRKQEWTFGELFHWFIEQHAKHRKRTWEQDVWQFEKYMGALAKQPVSRLTKAELRKFHAELGASSGPYTANKALVLIQSVFSRAIAHELIKGPNPVTGIEKFKEKSRDRRLTADELPRFLAAVEEAEPDLRDFVLLSLLTGARRGNVLAMRWDQIDWQGRAWRIPETKNGLPQTVPLNDEEIRILQERRARATGPWVFPGPGRTGHMVEPKKGWARILGRAGIEDFRIHDLRRTLGSWMVDTGATLHVVGKALNHQSQSTTAIYARLSLDPVREAKRAAHGAMLSIAKGERGHEGEPAPR